VRDRLRYSKKESRKFRRRIGPNCSFFEKRIEVQTTVWLPKEPVRSTNPGKMAKAFLSHYWYTPDAINADCKF